ncbi:hypothetical protein K9M59_02220 [Candidatus Gracilibacteria bacterium]|nr:hypothetical protein [Candidatus Gracilibacteria bacterium]MCF7819658.1 hypothetical protein [Candidatus Gracilibacteria bacterium]
MKKYLFLGLGLLCIGGAFIASSHAGVSSRYWRYPYRVQSSTCGTCPQNYVDPKERYFRNGCCDQGRVRPFSNRIGPFRYRRPTRSRLANEYLDFSHPSRRHDVWYYAQYRESVMNDDKRMEIYRALHPDLYPRNENRFATQRIVVRNDDYRSKTAFADSIPTLQIYREPVVVDDVNFIPAHISLRPETQYIGPKYTLEIPAGFTQGIDGDYKSTYNSLTFRISPTPEKYSCVQPSFELCAINLGKGFKDSQNLVQVSQLNRSEDWDQTVGRQMLLYPTFTESFHATAFGSQNIYFIFSALDPSDGSVIRIEAVAKEHDAEIAAQVMKKVFQSFRFQL